MTRDYICDLCPINYIVPALFHWSYSVHDARYGEYIEDFDQGNYCSLCFNKVSEHYKALGIDTKVLGYTAFRNISE